MDLSFACGAAELLRSDFPGLPHLRLETVNATVAKSLGGVVTVPAGLNALSINFRGTMIARLPGAAKMILIPPRSITFIRGGSAGSKLVVLAARGEHSAQILTWHGAMTPLLDSWIIARQRQGQVPGQAPGRTVACKPIDPQFNDVIKRFEQAKAVGPELAEPLLLSVIYEVVSRLMVGSDEVQLAAIPVDLPETIRELTEKVRKTPTNPWPLREAASMAGYSPFHFSRVFKSLVGYGFHEYVDRCRTGLAVDLLCTTENPVDLVASSSGFGTTQGLRESVKEYLGLVPSEFRLIPDVLDTLVE